MDEVIKQLNYKDKELKLIRRKKTYFVTLNSVNAYDNAFFLNIKTGSEKFDEKLDTIIKLKEVT